MYILKNVFTLQLNSLLEGFPPQRPTGQAVVTGVFPSCPVRFEHSRMDGAVVVIVVVVVVVIFFKYTFIHVYIFQFKSLLEILPAAASWKSRGHRCLPSLYAQCIPSLLSRMGFRHSTARRCFYVFVKKVFFFCLLRIIFTVFYSPFRASRGRFYSQRYARRAVVACVFPSSPPVFTCLQFWSCIS